LSLRRHFPARDDRVERRDRGSPPRAGVRRSPPLRLARVRVAGCAPFSRPQGRRHRDGQRPGPESRAVPATAKLTPIWHSIAAPTGHTLRRCSTGRIAHPARSRQPHPAAAMSATSLPTRRTACGRTGRTGRTGPKVTQPMPPCFIIPLRHHWGAGVACNNPHDAPAASAAAFSFFHSPSSPWGPEGPATLQRERYASSATSRARSRGAPTNGWRPSSIGIP